jgi:hypothetical protein
MKPASLILFAILTMTFVPQAAMADTTAFDGTWFVTVDAQDYKNPDSTMAHHWAIQFPAEVKKGCCTESMAPEARRPGGKIEADGTANLRTKGITKEPDASANHPRLGTPYEYQVIAHFSGRHGTGKSVGLRTRILTFVKD